jgi:glycosyltransferase involved in cell wall biosynthesis
MGALVFVTTELSPFTPGGIGRVVHNILKSMSEHDRGRSVIVALDVAISHADFSAVFPSIRLVSIRSDDDSGRFEAFEHHPPRSAYSNTDFHWKSTVVYRALRKLAQSEEIDYVEFPDWGGLGFASVQEKKIGGFLRNACLAVRLHSTHSLLLQNEARLLRPQDLNLVDLERKALRDCDLVVAPLAPVAEATRRILGIAESEWAPRLVIQAPPVLLDTTRPADVGCVPSSSTPIIFGTTMQKISRPDLFVRGVSCFCNLHPQYRGDIFLSAHSFDADYRDFILGLVSTATSDRFHFDAPQARVLREPLIANSVFVVPSDFESFCLPAYEASLLGAVVVVNEHNAAFGDGTPWRDGVNCVKFDGTALGLAEAIERSFALERPLSAVTLPSDPRPWAEPARTAGHPPSATDVGSPLVSVLIPHFNLGSYLVETLTSVREQTYANIEIIIVDDHSTEPVSRDLIATFRRQARDALKVIDAPANLGLAGARNLGVTAATGKYLVPLDADDLLDRRFIQIAVEALERNPEFDVVVPQAGYFRDGEAVMSPGETGDFNDYSLFVGEALVAGVRENRFSTATALFRAETLTSNRYCESLTCYEDWNVYFRLAQFGHRFLVTTGVYFFYRSRHGSMVRAAHQRNQHAIFLHDALRTAVDVTRSVPLAYLGYCAQSAADTSARWPGGLDPETLRVPLLRAAKYQILSLRIKRFFTYASRKSRQRYRAKLDTWKSIRSALRA